MNSQLIKQAKSLDFCPELQDVFKSNSMPGRSGKIHDIKAISSPANCVLLHALVKKFRPKRSLEIGFAKGGSTVAICSALRELGIEPTKQHVVIDPFETEVWDDTGTLLVEKAGFADYVELVQLPSHMAVPKLIENNQKFDFIYIDGSHFFEYVMTDFFLADKILEVGGIVIFDDTNRRHVNKVTDFVSKNMKRSYQEFPLDEFHRRLPNSFRRTVKKAIGRRDTIGFKKVSNFERIIGEPLVDF